MLNAWSCVPGGLCWHVRNGSWPPVSRGWHVKTLLQLRKFSVTLCETIDSNHWFMTQTQETFTCLMRASTRDLWLHWVGSIPSVKTVHNFYETLRYDYDSLFDFFRWEQRLFSCKFDWAACVFLSQLSLIAFHKYAEFWLTDHWLNCPTDWHDTLIEISCRKVLRQRCRLQVEYLDIYDGWVSWTECNNVL